MASLRDIKRKIRALEFALLLLSVAWVANVLPKPAHAQEQKGEFTFSLLAPDGTPVADSAVDISFQAELQEVRQSGSREAKTDDKGTLRFLDATFGGKYELNFWVHGVGFATLQNFQSAKAQDQPKIVRLSPGVTLRVLCVEATTGAPKPLGNILVLAQHLNVQDGTIPQNDLSGGSSYKSLSRDGSGIVEFEGIPPGTYILRAGNNLGYEGFARLLEIGESAPLETVMLGKAQNSAVTLNVVDANDKPVRGQEFGLRTSYAPLSDEMKLSGKERIPVAESLQWYQDLRFSPGGYPLRFRVLQTDEAGQVTIYPMGSGRWKLALVSRGSTYDNAVLSDEITVKVSNGATTSATLKLKPNTKF